MNKQPFFAEIFESNLSTWTGLCWNWDHVAPFGSLVVTQYDDIVAFGITYNIKTGSNDPLRTPVSYQKTQEELQRDQPQIFAFLQTTFQCITVGFEQRGALFYHVPSHPPKIHAFIRAATKQEYQTFFKSDQFLHMLFNQSSQIANFEELLLATIKNLEEQSILNKEKLNDFIDAFSILFKHDYQKLKIFLQRMQHIQETSSRS